MFSFGHCIIELPLPPPNLSSFFPQARQCREENFSMGSLPSCHHINKIMFTPPSCCQLWGATCLDAPSMQTASFVQNERTVCRMVSVGNSARSRISPNKSSSMARFVDTIFHFQNSFVACNWKMTKTLSCKTQTLISQTSQFLPEGASTWWRRSVGDDLPGLPNVSQMCRNAKTSKNVPNGSSLSPSSKTTTGEMTIVLICWRLLTSRSFYRLAPVALSAFMSCLGILFMSARRFNAIPTDAAACWIRICKQPIVAKNRFGLRF